jgi:hypothetical protein
MRSFLNAILAFIGAESLTDEEFDSVEATAQSYNQASYDDLSRIVLARDGVSTIHDRLNYYYLARGVEIEESDTAKSEVFIGGQV